MKHLEKFIGSLLTRIFKHHDIDLSKTPCVDTIDRFDVQFLQNTRTLYPSKIYRFTISNRTILHCQLPQPAITSLTFVENMQFMPPAKVLYTPSYTSSKMSLWFFFFGSCSEATWGGHHSWYLSGSYSRPFYGVFVTSIYWSVWFSSTTVRWYTVASTISSPWLRLHWSSLRR